MGEIDPVLLTSLRNEVCFWSSVLGYIVMVVWGFAVDCYHATYIVAHCNCSCIQSFGTVEGHVSYDGNCTPPIQRYHGRMSAVYKLAYVYRSPEMTVSQHPTIVVSVCHL